MTEVGRAYVDGANNPRTLLVDVNGDGRDSFGGYDTNTHDRLDSLINAYTEFSAVTVAIGTGLTTAIEVDCSRWSKASLEIQNGANTLTAFKVQFRYHSTGNYFDRLTTTADFVDIASADLTVLGSGLSAWLELDVSKVQSLRLQASGGAATTLTILGIAK